jgi:hypothetical protein
MLSREALRDQVRRNVDAVRRLVDRQRCLIAERKTKGQHAETSEHLLSIFERAQASFEADLNALVKEENDPRYQLIQL